VQYPGTCYARKYASSAILLLFLRSLIIFRVYTQFRLHAFVYKCRCWQFIVTVDHFKAVILFPSFVTALTERAQEKRLYVC